MLYILALIIVLYSASYVLFKTNPNFLKHRKWVDLSALASVFLLTIFWYPESGNTLIFVLYFLVSLGLIVYLYLKVNKLEIKKSNAEEKIKILKDEEAVLESEIKKLKNTTSQQ